MRKYIWLVDWRLCLISQKVFNITLLYVWFIQKKRKKRDTRVVAGKFFNIVQLGLEMYAEEKQKELNNRRWSRIRHAFKSINSFKK